MLFLFLFMSGASLASFISSCSQRIINQQSLLFPRRSYCDSCHTILQWWHLVPIISYCFLRGRCFFCHQRINYFLPIIELLSGIAVASLIIFEPVHDLIILIFISTLIFLSITDLVAQSIYPLALLGLFPIVTLSSPQDFLSNLVSATIITVALMLFTAVTNSLGTGDIEFLFSICLIWGWWQTILIIQASSLIMLVFFVCRSPKRLPFIPALAFSTLCSLIFQGC